MRVRVHDTLSTILLLLSFTISLESSCLDHYWWRTGGFCAGGGPRSLSERLHEVSLGAKIVADRGAVLALFPSLLDERVLGRQETKNALVV